MNALVKSMFVRSVTALDDEGEAELPSNTPAAPTPATGSLDMNRLVQAFVNLRDARLKASHEFEALDRDLKAKQARIGAAMLKFLNEHDMDSVATDAGTFYRQEELTPTGSDWDRFYKWIAENDAFDALERRIKKTFVKEYIEQHDGAIPPGVSIFREYVVRVRRS